MTSTSKISENIHSWHAAPTIIKHRLLRRISVGDEDSINKISSSFLVSQAQTCLEDGHSHFKKNPNKAVDKYLECLEHFLFFPIRSNTLSSSDEENEATLANIFLKINGENNEDTKALQKQAKDITCDALLHLAGVCLKLHDTHVAAYALGLALDLDPNSSDAYYLRAVGNRKGLCLSLHSPLDDLQRALALDPENLAIQQALCAESESAVNSGMRKGTDVNAKRSEKTLLKNGIIGETLRVVSSSDSCPFKKNKSLPFSSSTHAASTLSLVLESDGIHRPPDFAGSKDTPRFTRDYPVTPPASLRRSRRLEEICTVSQGVLRRSRKEEARLLAVALLQESEGRGVGEARTEDKKGGFGIGRWMGRSSRKEEREGRGLRRSDFRSGGGSGVEGGLGRPVGTSTEERGRWLIWKGMRNVAAVLRRMPWWARVLLAAHVTYRVLRLMGFLVNDE